MCVSLLHVNHHHFISGRKVGHGYSCEFMYIIYASAYETVETQHDSNDQRSERDRRLDIANPSSLSYESHDNSYARHLRLFLAQLVTYYAYI